jgi:hypothetical protein
MSLGVGVAPVERLTPVRSNPNDGKAQRFY